MSNRGIRIKIEKEQISFVKTISGSSESNVWKKDYKELRISRIFHKALNRYKLTGIFEKNDFEILGNMLYQILTGKDEAGDVVKKFLHDDLSYVLKDENERCRIYLEFKDADDIAVLPWEYLRVQPYENRPAFYLAAEAQCKFDVIRSVGNERVKHKPVQGKPLNIILYIASTSVDENHNINAGKLMDCFGRLAEKFKDKVSILPLRLEPSPSPTDFRERLCDIMDTIQNEPYIFHFSGHAMMDDKENKPCIGFIDSNEKVKWISDKKFADFFDANNAENKYPMPELVILQACESGQISEDSRGIGLQTALKKIPAVIAMQNEITEEDANAFIEKFYESILSGDDIGKAVTKGRTYLGREHGIQEIDDREGREQQLYTNNTFGTPVLFISTEEPFALMPPLEIEQPVVRKIVRECSKCGKPFTNPEGDFCKIITCRGKLKAPRAEATTATKKKDEKAKINDNNEDLRIDPLTKNNG